MKTHQTVWQKVKAHKTVTLGFVLLLLPILIILSSYFFKGSDPFTIRPWKRLAKPLTSIPLCNSENIFVVGADVPELFTDAQTSIRMNWHSFTSNSYRIVLKHGMVKRIWDMADNKILPTLEIDAEPRKISSQQFANGSLTSLKGGLKVVEGQPLPDQLQAENRVVIISERILAMSPQEALITVDSGKVTNISVNGKNVQQQVIAGEFVKNVKLDGEFVTKRFWLGADALGRDVLSRVIEGGKISIMIAVIATLVSLIIGVVYGAVSGYVGGKTDRVMMGAVDILYAIPFMFFIILLLTYCEGKDSLIVLFAALGAVQWLTMSRIVRASVKSIRNQAFVQAAITTGTSPFKLIFRHILPNCWSPIIVYTTLTVPAVILEESFLSFIGLSVQYEGRTLDSWGALVKQGMDAMGSNGQAIWVLICPAIAMSVTLLGFNLLGDGVRDILDPKFQAK